MKALICVEIDFLQINKTEWLNGYYEDIVHTDIQQFFTKLSKIFGPMNSDSVCDFIKGDCVRRF